MIDAGPEPGSWTRLPAMAEGARSLLETWEQWRVEADEYRELDDERVLVLVHLSGRGKTSGLDIGRLRAEVAFLFHVRGGKVTRHVVYWDRERALLELGLVP